MPAETNMSDARPPETKSFLSTLPGVLTAIAGSIAAIASLLTALNLIGVIGRPKPTATPALAPTPHPGAAAAPSTTLGPTATHAPPTATPSATPAPKLTPGVLLDDQFAGACRGWDVDKTAEYEVDCRDGEYRIAVNAEDLDVWGNSKAGYKWTDYVVQVDARRVDGPLDNEYGVLVRYQSDHQNFYFFSVSSDGMYTVRIMQADKWTDLIAWTESKSVAQGSATNSLRVECLGPRFRFFVNGDLLATIEDRTFPVGDVGLLAGALGEPGAVVHFDNLQVRALVK